MTDTDKKLAKRLKDFAQLKKLRKKIIQQRRKQDKMQKDFEDLVYKYCRVYNIEEDGVWKELI
jgi:inorganic pyrophosphatase/exopolyphosphatase